MADNEKENTANNTAPLNENELGDVNGGLWDITIWDTCTHQFDFQKCCRNFGQCPNLIAKNTNTRYDHEIEGYMFDYVLSCAKGYFHNVNASTNKLLPNY